VRPPLRPPVLVSSEFLQQWTVSIPKNQLPTPNQFPTPQFPIRGVGVGNWTLGIDIWPPSTGSEAHARRHAKGSGTAHLPDESRWRELREIRERDRDVVRVERIPDPRFGEQPFAARAATEVGERIGVLLRQVRVVVLERAVEDRLRVSVEADRRIER